MILVIIGTNRPGSKTALFAERYKSIVKEMTDEKVELVNLEDVQEGMLHSQMYKEDQQAVGLSKVQDELFIPAEKWIIISPEYNGSFPGVLKLLLDALSVRDADKTFQLKKVALVGIASGRGGNWLGMNQLTAILNYLKMNVYFNKLAISNISHEMDEQGALIRDKTVLFIKKQVRGFLKF